MQLLRGWVTRRKRVVPWRSERPPLLLINQPEQYPPKPNFGMYTYNKSKQQIETNAVNNY